MTTLVTDIQERILKILNLYDRLTREQVNRALGYRPSTTTTTWGHLKKLQENGLVDHVNVALNPGVISAPTKVYFVSTNGRKYLRAIGIETPERKKIKDAEGDLSVAFWRHALLVNDFFISAQLLEKDKPALTIEGALTDIDIRRDPGFPIQTANGSYKPDGYLEVIMYRRRHTFCLELERGVYSEGRWVRKVERMLGFYDVSDAENLRFLVIAMEGDRHRRQLQEITDRTAGRRRDLFVITDYKPDDLRLFDFLITY